MNQMQRAVYAANMPGMGLWSPELEGMNPGGSPALKSGDGIIWGDIFGGAFSTIGNILNNRNRPQQGNLPQQANTLSVADQLAIYEAQRKAKEDEIGSGSISSKGIKFGDTTISWPTIMLGIGVVYLVQSPGFSKRR